MGERYLIPAQTRGPVVGELPLITECAIVGLIWSAFSLARSCSLASLPAPVNRSPQSPPSNATTAVLSISLYGLLEAVIMLLVVRSEPAILYE